MSPSRTSPWKTSLCGQDVPVKDVPNQHCPRSRPWQGLRQASRTSRTWCPHGGIKSLRGHHVLDEEDLGRGHHVHTVSWCITRSGRACIWHASEDTRPLLWLVINFDFIYFGTCQSLHTGGCRCPLSVKCYWAQKISIKCKKVLKKLSVAKLSIKYLPPNISVIGSQK